MRKAGSIPLEDEPEGQRCSGSQPGAHPKEPQPSWMDGRGRGRASLRSPVSKATSVSPHVGDDELLRDGQEMAEPLPSTRQLCQHRCLIYSNKINNSPAQKKCTASSLHPPRPPSSNLSPANGQQQLCLEKKTDVFMGPMNLTGKPTTPDRRLREAQTEP